MCPNLHARNKPEHNCRKEKNSSNILGYVATAGISSLLTLGAVWAYNNFYSNKREKDFIYEVYKACYDNANGEEKKFIKVFYEYWLYVMDHAGDKLNPIGEVTDEQTIKLEDTKEYELFHNFDEKVDDVIKKTYGKKNGDDYNNDIQIRFTLYFMRLCNFEKEYYRMRRFVLFFFQIGTFLENIDKFEENFRDIMKQSLSCLDDVFIKNHIVEKAPDEQELKIVDKFLKIYFNIDCQELVWFYKVFDTKNIKKTIKKRPESLDRVTNFKDFVLFLVRSHKLRPEYQNCDRYFVEEISKIN